MSEPAQVTLADIAEKSATRLRQLGVTTDNQTVEAALVQMMAALGELATLSYRHATTLSPFERDEAALVLGRMTVALSTVGTCLDVDVGAAALRVLGEHSTAVPMARTAAARQSSPEADPTGGAVSYPPKPAGGLQLMLSPTSRDGFFTYLDRLAGERKDVVEGANLRWVVPDEDGYLEELMPGGANTPVAYDAFPLYYNKVQQWRQARRPQAVNAPPSVSAVAPAAPLTMAVPGYDAAREAKMFSPTHFSNGLFSPRADLGPSDLFHAQVRPPSAVLPRAPPAERNDERSSFVPAHTPSTAVAPAVPAPAVHTPQTLSPADFDAVVEYLRKGLVTGPQIAQLGLAFCYPQGDSVVDLVPDGLQIMVTAANCKEFLRLLDAARRTDRGPAPERIHRMDSVRRLQSMASPPKADASSFSPSHFQHGLFAPFTDKTALYVDYDAHDRTLPPALRGRTQDISHQSSQETLAPQTRSSAARETSSGATTGADAPTSSLYMDAVRAVDYNAMSQILAQVRAAPEAIDTYGVVFAIPSALEPKSTPAEKVSGVHEFFPGSSKRRVTLPERPLFLSLVEQYFPSSA